MLRAQVLASEAAGPAWQRLAVRVLAVYKQPAWPVRRGGQDAWVPRADLACGCLRLRPTTHYLLLGSAAAGPEPARLVLDRHGLALPWRPRWARPLRRLQQEERAGGCHGLRPAAFDPEPRTQDLEPEPGGLKLQGRDWKQPPEESSTSTVRPPASQSDAAEPLTSLACASTEEA